MPQGNVPGEWYSPTQPIPTKPPAFDQQGVTENDLIDFTPELKAEALKIVSQYKYGPVYTPPTLLNPNGPKGTIFMPGTNGGADWGGAAFDKETGILYVPSSHLSDHPGARAVAASRSRRCPRQAAGAEHDRTAGAARVRSSRPTRGWSRSI